MMLASSCSSSSVGGSLAVGQVQRRLSPQAARPACRRPSRRPPRLLAFRGGHNGSGTTQLQTTPDFIHATKVRPALEDTQGAGDRADGLSRLLPG